MVTKPFICFDGLDASGKDTQARLLASNIHDGNTFISKSSSIWLTKEQTDLTQEGCLITQKLKQNNFSPNESTELFIKDRLVHTKFINQIKKHSVVVCVRYFLSTLAYQSVQGVDINTLWNMHIKPRGFFDEGYDQPIIIPDFYFYIDITPEESIKRIMSKRKNIEVFENFAMLQKVHEQYHKVIHFLQSKNISIFTINGMQSINDIQENILTIFNNGRTF